MKFDFCFFRLTRENPVVTGNFKYPATEAPIKAFDNLSA